MLMLVLLAAGAQSPMAEFPNSIGASCESAYQAERLRRGKPTTSQQSTSNGTADFVGEHGGKAAFIHYECRNSLISVHGITVSFSEEAPARSFLQTERTALDKRFGTSRSIYQCLSSSRKRRLETTRPDAVTISKNTYSWPSNGGPQISVSIDFDVEDLRWNVTLMSTRGSSLCQR